MMFERASTPATELDDVKLKIEQCARIGLFAQRDTEGVVLNKNDIVDFLLASATIHRAVSNVDHRSDVCIHLFVYSTLSPFFFCWFPVGILVTD